MFLPTSYLFCLPTDAPQHERLPAASNDPPFLYWEMINCKIRVTFSVPHQLLQCFSVCTKLHRELHPVCNVWKKQVVVV